VPATSPYLWREWRRSGRRRGAADDAPREADRIITLITPEHGKVRAVAKGVRKTKSKLGGRLDLVTHVSLLCWRGRELDVITQAEIIDLYRPIREDLDKMPVAFTMLEVVDQVAVERHACPICSHAHRGADHARR